MKIPGRSVAVHLNLLLFQLFQGAKNTSHVDLDRYCLGSPMA